MANKYHHETSGKFLATSDVRGFKVNPPTQAPELAPMVRAPEPPPPPAKR